MQIGRARPLCCFCWVLSCTVATCIMASWNACVLSFILGITAATVLALLFVGWCWRRPRYTLWYMAWLALALSVGLSAVLIYELHTLQPAREFVEASQQETVELQGLVVSQPSESSYFHAYELRVDLPGGDSALTYLSVTGDCNARVGDRISLKAYVTMTMDAEDEPWRIRSWLSDGYVLVAEDDGVTPVEIVSHGQKTDDQVFSDWQQSMSARMRRAIGGEGGKLAAALLLGTRETLSDQTTLDFRRAGASHLLALSGLHLSLIVLILGAILRALYCPYWLRSLLLCTAAVTFLLLTGCSISTQRATFMLLCLYVSRLRGAPHDALTPLSVFLALCLAIRPTWLYDVGLWMTVLATFAVVEMVPGMLKRTERQGKKNLCRRIVRLGEKYILFPVLSTLIVLLVLMIPMALTFGEFSWVAPLSNLLLTPLTALVLGLGLALLPLLLLADTWPWLEELSETVAGLLSRITDAMLYISRELSDVRGALVSLRYDFMPHLLAILLVLLLVFLFFRWEKPKHFWFVAAGWTVTLLSCLWLTRISSLTWELTYTQVGKGELLTFDRTNTTVLCDLTDGSYRTYRALLSDGLPDGTTEIEALVLTHYHSRHISTIYKLLADMRVREIWLPLTMPDATEEKARQDESIVRSIAELAKSRRTKVHYYLPDEGAAITETLQLERLYYSMIKRSTHPTLAMRWSCRSHVYQSGSRMVVLGGSAWEGEWEEQIFNDLAACDMLLLAEHGPKIKSEYTIPYWADEPSLVVFANGNVSAAMTATPETSAALHAARLVLASETHSKFEIP